MAQSCSPVGTAARRLRPYQPPPPPPRPLHTARTRCFGRFVALGIVHPCDVSQGCPLCFGRPNTAGTYGSGLVLNRRSGRWSLGALVGLRWNGIQHPPPPLKTIWVMPQMKEGPLDRMEGGRARSVVLVQSAVKAPGGALPQHSAHGAHAVQGAPDVPDFPQTFLPNRGRTSRRPVRGRQPRATQRPGPVVLQRGAHGCITCSPASPQRCLQKDLRPSCIHGTRNY